MPFWKWTATISSLALLVAACGGAGGNTADDTGGDTGSGGENEAAMPADGDVGAETDRTVDSIALLLPGRKDDAGYSGTGYRGLIEAAEQYGIEETAVAEEVDVAQQVEVYRDFASQGFDLVFGWGGQFEDGAAQVAEEFPDTYFVVGAGSGGNGSNYGSIDYAGRQWTYLLGWVAGKVSQSGKVGYIGGPCAANTARKSHAFALGVEAANPEAEVLLTGLDSFDDPAAAREAALAQIDQGVDVIHAAMNTGNLGVYEAAEAHTDVPVFVVTEFGDYHEESPQTILTSATRDQAAIIAATVDAIESGEFAGEKIEVTMTTEHEPLAPFRSLADESIYEQAQEVQAQIASGEIDVPAASDCPYGSQLD
jgi:basic membrane protein A